MDKLGDIELFVKIVKHKGLAAAAKQLGISAASTTARLKRLESIYGVRLLNRTTRRIALTEEGKEFYESCLRVLAELKQAEERLVTGRDFLSGRLKITTTVDLGKQQIAPLLAEFVEQNPNVSAHLHLADHVVDLLEDEYDLAIRYGHLQDSRMIARKLASNSRVLCASPDYLQKNGTPTKPQDLNDHQCITMERKGQSLTNWYFDRGGSQSSVTVQSLLSSSDGEQVRKWALAGLGIALKSYWDVKNDLDENRLVVVLGDYQKNYDSSDSNNHADLNAVYPSKEFLPERTRAFIDLLVRHFQSSARNLNQ